MLTRTNAEALRQLLYHLEQGRRVALVGGSRHLAMFCQAAVDLAETGRTNHPDLACFSS